VIERLRKSAKGLKVDTYALYLAYRDPRVPWYAKAFAATVVAYALSPIDLIPDFIPVLGYLDDLVLVPLGIWIALKMIPGEVMVEARRQAAQEGRIESRAGSAIVVAVWVVGCVVMAYVIYRVLTS
jgi:uncharacterized membrane protein YkvA (DUF1232 family)